MAAVIVAMGMGLTDSATAIPSTAVAIVEMAAVCTVSRLSPKLTSTNTSVLST